jgi:alpha-1,2-mannosyltransferase
MVGKPGLDEQRLAPTASGPTIQQFTWWVLLWMGGSFIAICYIVAELQHLQGVLFYSDGEVGIFGGDFSNVWAGGKMAAAGALNDLYDPPRYHRFLQSVVGPITERNYSYPPQSLFGGYLLSHLPYFAALTLWTGLGAAFFWFAARPYMREAGMPTVLAILTPAALINVWAGHYGFFVGGLWLLAFSSMGTYRAGVFGGLMLIKPHMALFLPLVTLFRGYWKTIVVAGVTVAVTVVVSGLAFGFERWREFVVDVSAYQTYILENGLGQFYWRMMPTTYTSAITLGATDSAAWAVQTISAAVAIGLATWATIKGATNRELAFIYATATFLTLPYGFNYDMPVVGLGFAIAIHSRWGDLSIFERVGLIAAFVIPQYTMVLSPVGVPVTPLVLLVALFAQVRLAVGLPSVARARSGQRA